MSLATLSSCIQQLNGKIVINPEGFIIGLESNHHAGACYSDVQAALGVLAG